MSQQRILEPGTRLLRPEMVPEIGKLQGSTSVGLRVGRLLWDVPFLSTSLLRHSDHLQFSPQFILLFGRDLFNQESLIEGIVRKG